MKQCTHCKQNKNNDQFYLCRNSKHGLSSWCKDCHRERERTKERVAYNAQRSRFEKHKDYLENRERTPERIEYNRQRENNEYRKRASDIRHRIHTLGNGKYWNSLVAFYAPDGKCPSCGRDAPLVVDHVVPLSKVMDSGFANIQPLCANCNGWKGQKIIDFRPDSGAFASSLDELVNSMGRNGRPRSGGSV